MATYSRLNSSDFLGYKLTSLYKINTSNTRFSNRRGRQNDPDYSNRTKHYRVRLENPETFMVEHTHINNRRREMPHFRLSSMKLEREADGMGALLTKVIEPDCAYVKSMIDAHKEENTEYALTYQVNPPFRTEETIIYPDIVIYATANDETPIPIIPIEVKGPGLLNIKDFGGENARYGRSVEVIGQGRIFMEQIEEYANVAGSRYAALTDFITTILIDFGSRFTGAGNSSEFRKIAILTDTPGEPVDIAEKGTRFVFCCLILLALRQNDIPFHAVAVESP